MLNNKTMASPALTSNHLLLAAKETLRAAQLLMKKSDPDAQMTLTPNQATEQLCSEVGIFQTKFDNTLQIAVQLQFLGNDSKLLVKQLSDMFEAYGLLRDAFEILRITVPDDQHISKQSVIFHHRLVEKMQSQSIQLLNCFLKVLSGNINAPQKTLVLETFHICVNHFKDGALENWRREQKHNILGIRVRPNEITEAMKLLQIAHKGFRDLMYFWTQIIEKINQGTDETFRKKAIVELKYLLQSSFIVDWSMCGCGERKNKVRHAEKGECRKKIQPPSVISRNAMVDEDKVTVIPKLLAIGGEGCPKISARFTLQFIRPAGQDTGTISEEIARKLRDNVDDNFTQSAIERGGKINNTSELTDDGKFADGYFGVEFKNVTLCFEGESKRPASQKSGENQPSPPNNKKNQEKRKIAETKYHMHFTAQVNIPNHAKNIELKTISTPFMISVNGPQFSQISRAMLWSTLASSSNSVSFSEGDNAAVPWGTLGEAIKWYFYKQTKSRELRDDEVNHIGYQIYKLNSPKCKGNEFKPSPLMQLNRGHIQNTSARHADSKNGNQGESYDTKFSFWDWYFNAMEMVDDRGSKLLPTKMVIKHPDREDWRTMAGLFRAGVVYGFIGREEATKILRTFPSNALLLRISDHFSAGITVSYRRIGPDLTSDSVDHVPLSRSMLASGLPELIAKLTQLEGIEEIVVGPQLCVKKRDLVGSLGPTLIFPPEYEYTNAQLKNFIADKGDRSTQQLQSPTNSGVSFNDDQLRSLAIFLGPASIAKLASCVSDLSVTTTQPANFVSTGLNQQSSTIQSSGNVQPSGGFFANNADNVLIQQSSDQQWRIMPPCQYQPPQSWNSQGMMSNDSDDSMNTSAQNFHVHQQQTRLRTFHENGAFSPSQQENNNLHMSCEQQPTVPQPMFSYQSQHAQPHIAQPFHKRMEDAFEDTRF